jgi:hypothetical protein
VLGTVTTASRQRPGALGQGERGHREVAAGEQGSEAAWGSGLGNWLAAGGVGGSCARAAFPRSRGAGV